MHALDAPTFAAISSRCEEANYSVLLCAVEHNATKKSHEMQLKELLSEASKTKIALASCTSVNTDLNNKLQALQQGRNITDTIDGEASKKIDIAASYSRKWCTGGIVMMS